MPRQLSLFLKLGRVEAGQIKLGRVELSKAKLSDLLELPRPLEVGATEDQGTSTVALASVHPTLSVIMIIWTQDWVDRSL